MKLYTLKTVLINFKERGNAAVTKLLTQLHVLETVAPVDVTKLTKKQISEAVASLMFLKENQNRYIKGGACADIINTIKIRTWIHPQLP